MAPLPLAKLGGLLIKTLSKPVAKRIKSQMVKYEATRNGLIWVGQKTHVLSTRMTIWSSGYKVRSINPLEEGEALSQGAEILSESFIFLVSGSIVVFEYQRSSEKEKRKEAERLQKIRDNATNLHAKLVSLDKRLEALEEYAKANRKTILGLEIGANYVDPKNVIPIDDGGDVSEKHVETARDGGSNSASDDENGAEKQPSKKRWYWPF